jgi:hypothetical protein
METELIPVPTLPSDTALSNRLPTLSEHGQRKSARVLLFGLARIFETEIKVLLIVSYDLWSIADT